MTDDVMSDYVIDYYIIAQILKLGIHFPEKGWDLETPYPDKNIPWQKLYGISKHFCGYSSLIWF